MGLKVKPVITGMSQFNRCIATHQLRYGILGIHHKASQRWKDYGRTAPGDTSNPRTTRTDAGLWAATSGLRD